MNNRYTIVLSGILELIHILENEAKELTKKNVSSQDHLVFVEECSSKDASTLAYRSQGTYHVGIELCKVKLDGANSPKEHEEKLLEEIKKLTNEKKEELKEYLTGINSFKVQSVKLRECEYSSTDYNVDIGSACKQLCEEIGFDVSVNLKQPDMQFLYLIDKVYAVLIFDLIC